jgi:hypothetical protein
MKARKKIKTVQMGILGACLLGLLGMGCENIPGVTPSVFLPPLSYCTPVAGVCSFPIEGDLTANITYAEDPPDLVMGDTTGGTNNFDAGVNFGWPGPDHVYSFTLCHSRRITVSTCGTAWDTVVMVTGGTCAGELLNNPGAPEEDDGCTGLAGPSKVSLTLPAGLYYVIVDGYNGASGPYQLSITTP